MCNCTDIDFGTYDNMLLLGYYPCMREYAENRKTAGLSNYGIGVDKCIVAQVVNLWEAGIRTYGCCCGHNKTPGFINLDERDFSKALELGWGKYEYPNDKNRCDTVKTRNI
ncbi:hypothetical protein KA005_41675 [bacterium]|nr:hypothetical protein [bacterium]